jgi:prepilin-type N-terminal cleavage/methylation domain-containing protein
VKKEFSISGLQFPVESRKSVAHRASIANGFTLIEVMVVVSLLSLIVLALMTVFNSTQAAFRASVTQSDVLEGGRAAMDLMAADLKQMSPSLGQTNNLANNFQGAVNFYAAVPSGYSPLVQSLVASGQMRTNVLENFFILNRQNQTWTGIGYAVDTTNTLAINPLYRFSMSTNVAAGPAQLYAAFINTISAGAWTNMSRLMDGVVHLTVRAYDNNGYWMTNTFNFAGGQTTTNKNVRFQFPSFGEVGFQMFSNTLPASVEIQMAVLEDRVLQRAESLGANFQAQSNYLAQQAGKVHVFRQRISIPNVDPAAYQ